MKPYMVYKNYHPDRGARYYGDQIFLHNLFKDKVIETEELPADRPGAIINIRGGDNYDFVSKLNDDISQLKWALIMVVGNEEGSDFYRQIKHPNCKIWIQSPKGDDLADYFLPVGYPSNIYDFLPTEIPAKIYDWSFAGQITHGRRHQMLVAARNLPQGKLIETPGFNQGVSYPEYVKIMTESKVVLCPGGATSPDTFRVYEALEAGCVPIVDLHSGYEKYNGNFWNKIFGPNPLLKVNEWSELPHMLDYALQNYKQISEQTTKWWKEYKESLVTKLFYDIYLLENQK